MERSRPPIVTELTAFTPLLVLIVTTVASTTYADALFTKPPEVLGIPLGAVIDGLAMLWMVIGAVIAWDNPSHVARALARVFFTLPATILVVLAPAVIQILRTLP